MDDHLSFGHGAQHMRAFLREQLDGTATKPTGPERPPITPQQKVGSQRKSFLAQSTSSRTSHGPKEWEDVYVEEDKHGPWITRQTEEGPTMDGGEEHRFAGFLGYAMEVDHATSA